MAWSAPYKAIFRLAAVLAVTAVIGLGWTALAATLPQKYPRLANYYLNSSLKAADVEKLAQWDLVVLGIELQYERPEIFRELRKRNPDIIILAYIPSEEIALKHGSISDHGNPLYKMIASIPEAWWLKDAGGQRTSNWPGTNMLNVTDSAPEINGDRWNTFLPKFVHSEVMSTGLWDGIFYDNVWPSISWLNSGNIDLNLDGAPDVAATADTAWQNGMAKILTASRSYEGAGAIIVGNGGGQYYPPLNGRLVEDFPSLADGGWAGAVQAYFDSVKLASSPTVVVVNGKSQTGRSDDYQTQRFTLASTLLSNGFFSFDLGSADHSALWDYDEYHAYLGLPLGRAQNLDQPQATTVSDGLWRRDFQNGIVLVNSTGQPRTVELGNGFVSILGSQDKITNNGQPAVKITLLPDDGRLLLRQLAEIDNGQFRNGALERVFSPQGKTLHPGFFSYNEHFDVRAEIIRSDVSGDGLNDRIIGAGDQVYVFDYYGSMIANFHPFGAGKTGFHLATGDVNGDKKNEIIVGSGSGTESRVRIFLGNGEPYRKQFTAYNKTFKNGVSVAAGDVNGDGRDEIVTGLDSGASPIVRTFTASGRKLTEFMPYPKTFIGGVSVAAGDVNGDGRDEIVTAPGPGRSPAIRILNASGQWVMRAFRPFPKTYQDGVSVSVSDMNHDGRLEVMASPLTSILTYTSNRSLKTLSEQFVELTLGK